MKIDLNSMITESRNSASAQIDTVSTLDMLRIINNEDKKVADAVAENLPTIAKVVDLISHAFSIGGRLIYMGAGTSGRLGILDASECPPTFGTPAEKVVGLIAGGSQAILKAVENAEDNVQLAHTDLESIQLTDKDVLVGIAASGRTPYVLGGLAYASSIGATTASITCNLDSPIVNLTDYAITPIVGPEIVTGSSRMKAGTAQKLILNMLTTGAMIRSGKVFGNLMVDVEATNEKLVQRQTNIVMQATGVDEQTAEKSLAACNQHCKTAILMILADVDAEEATSRLTQANGFIRNALNKIESER